MAKEALEEMSQCCCMSQQTGLDYKVHTKPHSSPKCSCVKVFLYKCTRMSTSSSRAAKLTSRKFAWL